MMPAKQIASDAIVGVQHRCAGDTQFYFERGGASIVFCTTAEHCGITNETETLRPSRTLATVLDWNDADGRSINASRTQSLDLPIV